MSYESTILADTPQAYYRLDESSGSSAFDATGHGYTAALSGALYTQPGALIGDGDSCMRFSVGGGLTLPGTLMLTSFTALSIELWIKAITDTDWSYLVISTNGSTTSLYLNLVPTSSSPPGSSSLDIGSLFDQVTTQQITFLDEVAVYNYQLSGAQMTAHYQAAGYGLPVVIPPPPPAVVIPPPPQHPPYNTHPFGIGIYQPLSNYTVIGAGFMPPSAPYVGPLTLPYSGEYGGVYGFVLNTMMRQPKVHVYQPTPVLGLDNLGTPVVRGFPTMVWSYSTLRPDYWYYLRNLYKLAGLVPLAYQYLVLLQYPDESAPDANPPIQQLAYWDPPTHAFRDVGSYQGVTLTFRYLGKAQLSSDAIVVPATS